MKSWKGGRKVTDVRCEENVDNATDVGLRMTESCDWVTEDTEDRTGRDGEQEGVSSWGDKQNTGFMSCGSSPVSGFVGGNAPCATSTGSNPSCDVSHLDR